MGTCEVRGVAVIVRRHRAGPLEVDLYRAEVLGVVTLRLVVRVRGRGVASCDRQTDAVEREYRGHAVRYETRLAFRAVRSMLAHQARPPRERGVIGYAASV